jgi:hypothetical protein
MEVERGMLCRGGAGVAGRPCQDVIQARIDRRIRRTRRSGTGRNQREFDEKARRRKDAKRILSMPVRLSKR